MNYITSWGYELTGTEILPNIITTEEYNSYTASKYSGDVRVSPAIAAASLALRNYCGWHLTGSLVCKISWTITNRGIIHRGSDMIIQLPARFVSAINSVKVAGEDITDFSFQVNGLLTLYDVGVSDRRDRIEVEYIAGIPDANVIKELVAQMVTLSLSKSYGVTSEAAGGVSITYNSAWMNGSYDQVLGNNAGMLAPYRLEGVF